MAGWGRTRVAICVREGTQTGRMGEGTGDLAGAAGITSTGEDGRDILRLSHPLPFCPPIPISPAPPLEASSGNNTTHLIHNLIPLWMRALTDLYHQNLVG